MKPIIKTINILKNTCIKCGKCARVCPVEIMVQKSTGDEISLNNTNSCVVCGHCVDVCPTNSVAHSVFPENKQHTIDYSLMPTPEQTMLLIKSRRSNRALSSKSIPKEFLDKIIEAAQYAPTATNSQEVRFTVVTEPETLLKISAFTVEIFDNLGKKLSNPIAKLILKPFLKDVYKYLPTFKRLKCEHEAGKDPVLRKATALLFFHTPKSSKLGCADANLAYQNASLMAQSLGVSQIYMGFVLNAYKFTLSAYKQGRKRALPNMLGIDGEIQAIMALGIPSFKYLKYTDRYL